MSRKRIGSKFKNATPPSAIWARTKARRPVRQGQLDRARRTDQAAARSAIESIGEILAEENDRLVKQNAEQQRQINNLEARMKALEEAA